MLSDAGRLDREVSAFYDLVMELDTLSAFANPRRRSTRIRVDVADVNDNAPQFVYDQGGIVEDQYLVAVPDSLPVGADVFQIKVRHSS